MSWSELKREFEDLCKQIGGRVSHPKSVLATTKEMVSCDLSKDVSLTMEFSIDGEVSIFANGRGMVAFFSGLTPKDISLKRPTIGKVVLELKKDTHIVLSKDLYSSGIAVAHRFKK